MTQLRSKENSPKAKAKAREAVRKFSPKSPLELLGCMACSTGRLAVDRPGMVGAEGLETWCQHLACPIIAQGVCFHAQESYLGHQPFKQQPLGHSLEGTCITYAEPEDQVTSKKLLEVLPASDLATRVLRAELRLPGESPAELGGAGRRLQLALSDCFKATTTSSWTTIGTIVSSSRRTAPAQSSQSSLPGSSFLRPALAGGERGGHLQADDAGLLDSLDFPRKVYESLVSGCPRSPRPCGRMSHRGGLS